MLSPQDLKAGPSEPTLRWTHEPSKSKRLFKALAIAIILSLGCFAFTQLSRDRQNIIWGKGVNHNSNEWHHESSKRTQYLLGVGKADITGYSFSQANSHDFVY